MGKRKRITDIAGMLYCVYNYCLIAGCDLCIYWEQLWMNDQCNRNNWLYVNMRDVFNVLKYDNYDKYFKTKEVIYYSKKSYYDSFIMKKMKMRLS